MNADIFAEWLRRQGYRVVRTASSYWYEAGARVLQAFPYHSLIEPSERELRDLLLRHGAIALRYSTPLSAGQGKVSYHVVCEDLAYDLASLARQARQNTRRGLEYARVEQISLSRLGEEGWRLRRDSLERQGRLGAENEAWWRRMCACAADLPGFEAWGALHDGELVASFLAFVCDDRFTLPHEQSATAHLEHRPNNALYYVVTRQAVRRPGIRGAFFGVHSLDAPASVDGFKLRMGLSAKPVRQRVVFHPFLAPLANRLSHAVIRGAAVRCPNSALLAKAEGMMRFYLQGQGAPEEQDWPECLAAHKGEVLAALREIAAA